jgi:hypothetical protein
MNGRNVFLSGVMAAALAGCVANPEPPAESAGGGVSPVPKGPVAVQPEEFTVTLAVGGDDEAGDGSGIRLSVAGPGAGTIALGSIRNVAQVIVLDEAGNIAAFKSVRRQNSTTSSASMTVNIPKNRTYRFLVLMGHQQREYGSEQGGGDYVYKDEPPTLLAAGLKEEYVTGVGTIKIIMKPLVVDTVFNTGGAELGAALPTPDRPGGVTFSPAAASITWTLDGAGFDTINTPPQASGSGITFGYEILSLMDASTVVWKNTGSGWGNSEYSDVLQGGFDGNKITLDISETAKTAGATGAANFNITYVPFGLTDGAKWSGVVLNGVETSNGCPVWTIRNGVNDEPQNPETTFDPTKSSGWGATANGNGAVVWTAGGGITVVDYDLQHYVPVPATGAAPVTELTRPDLKVTVQWKDSNGSPITAPSAFEQGKAYKAEITLTPNAGYIFATNTGFKYLTAAADDVTGNNSGAGERVLDVTYLAANKPEDITQAELTLHIPKPVLNGTPVTSFSAGTYTGTVEWDGNPGLFAANTPYTATVTLTPAQGYAFATTVTVTHGGAPGPITGFTYNSGDSKTRGGTIYFQGTGDGQTVMISDGDLTYRVPSPGPNMQPVGYFGGFSYTGTVQWYKGPPFPTEDSSNRFTGNFENNNSTAYKAVVKLTPAIGYAFPTDNTGSGVSFFTHGDESTITRTDGTGNVVVRIIFPTKVTAAELDLSKYLDKPAAPLAPQPTFTGSQYDAAVTWSPDDNSFQPNTAYSATVTLTAKEGYTFTGTTVTHSGATSANGSNITNNGKTYTVTFGFPETLINSFSGVANTMDSLIDIIKANKDETTYTQDSPLVLVMAGGTPETVRLDEGDFGGGGGLVLTHTGDTNTDTSPAFVTIDGGGRTVELTG